MFDSTNDNFDSNFHESDYDMKDDYDHIYEVNVDLEIERDMGLGKGCTVGEDNEEGSMVLFRDGVKGEDMNDDQCYRYCIDIDRISRYVPFR